MRGNLRPIGSTVMTVRSRVGDEEELAAEEEAKRAQEEMQARMSQQTAPTLSFFDKVVRAVEGDSRIP